MDLRGKKIGVCMTGSFCTFEKVIPQLKKLSDLGADLLPIMSENAYSWDTKFGPAKKWRDILEQITREKIIHTIIGAEPIGPGKLLDVVVVAPATGNTISALANGITDGPVLMACKAQWRNNCPVVLAISTNDGLGICAKNIGILHDKQNTYMVPYGQDLPYKKEKSLVAHFEYIPDTIMTALDNKQLQPILVPHVQINQ
ncbi:MAG: dipicolinate synthase subunit B [Halanaerobiales bacterium]|nr:dipicolinate synthase subunit B [Halanaerobiales bacterium]